MYPALNGTLVGQDLTQLLIYANSVTSNTFGGFVFWIVVSFFLIVLIGSMLAQLRFTGRVRPEVSLLAASFSTLGVATILEMRTGLLNPFYFLFLIAVNIIAIIWVAMSTE